MLGILTTADEVEAWLMAPWEEAKKLRRPVPDDMLHVVPAMSGEDG